MTELIVYQVIAGEIYRILYMEKLRYLLYNTIYNDLECIFGSSMKFCSESVMCQCHQLGSLSTYIGAKVLPKNGFLKIQNYV